VVSVIIDEPWVAHLGGQVAAPVFKRIAMRALARYGVAPSGDLAKTAVTFPLEDPTPRVIADLAAAAERAPVDDVTGPGGAVAATGTGTGTGMGMGGGTM